MGRHIGIAIPCQDHVDAFFAEALVKAIGHHLVAYPEDGITTSWNQSAFLAESRNILVKELLEQGCDWVIFLDTDMRFPQTLIEDLIKHDLPVMAANCAKRRRPISPTARKHNEDTGEFDAVWPDPEKKEGVERISVVGTAVMAIKAEVFMQLPYPWFHTPWHPEDQRFVGEDLYFCAQLKNADIPLHIDHGVSWGVGHVGQYTYRMQDVLGERELARKGFWDHIRPQQTTDGRPLIEVAR